MLRVSEYIQAMFCCFKDIFTKKQDKYTALLMFSNYRLILVMFVYLGAVHGSGGCSKVCCEGLVHQREVHGSVSADLL